MMKKQEDEREEEEEIERQASGSQAGEGVRVLGQA